MLVYQSVASDISKPPCYTLAQEPNLLEILLPAGSVHLWAQHHDHRAVLWSYWRLASHQTWWMRLRVAGQCLKRIGGVYTYIYISQFDGVRDIKTVRQFISFMRSCARHSDEKETSHDLIIELHKDNLASEHLETSSSSQPITYTGPYTLEDQSFCTSCLSCFEFVPSSSNPHCPCLPATAPISGDHPGSDWWPRNHTESSEKTHRHAMCCVFSRKDNIIHQWVVFLENPKKRIWSINWSHPQDVTPRGYPHRPPVAFWRSTP